MPLPLNRSYPRLGCCLALAIAGSAGADRATAADGTVIINGETKQLEGILRAAQSGDVACYLQLESDAGETFQESAVFELCEDASLIGQRLRLSYSVENVLAEACQGDVDCGLSDRVVLVSAARVVRATAPTPPAQQSFCTSEETVVFACRTGAKLVSVCASSDASNVSGYLQYRFGKPDFSLPLEMLLPSDRPVPRLAARGESTPFAGGGGSWLRFHHGSYAYVVYSGTGRWGPDGETMELQGVQVERDGSTLVSLPCTGPLQSELGPDWFERSGVISEGEEFTFPTPD